MKLDLYQLDFSPYCIPISAALTALGVRFRAIEVGNRSRAAIIKLTGGHVKLPRRLKALAAWERRLRAWRFASVNPPDNAAPA